MPLWFAFDAEPSQVCLRFDPEPSQQNRDKGRMNTTLKPNEVKVTAVLLVVRRTEEHFPIPASLRDLTEI
jgi:hypothetical protein